MGDVYMVNGKILSGLPNHAKDIEFDNIGIDLISTNAEDAIKEVNSNLITKRTLTSTISHHYPGVLNISGLTGYTLVSCCTLGAGYYVDKWRDNNGSYDIYITDATSGTPAPIDTSVDINIYEMKV